MNDNQKKGKLLSLKMKYDESKAKVSRATQIIFWVSGLNFLFAIFSYLSTNSMVVLIVSALISLFIAGLGFLSKASPLIGLILSFSILALLFIFDFLNVQMGLLAIAFRIATLVILAVGIYNVINAKKIIQEYDRLEASMNS